MISKGQFAEELAVKRLKKVGYKIVERNFHSYFGEIDIVARDKEYLVFVEVKFRKSDAFGGAVAAVTASKQNKIKKTAAYYLQKNAINSAVRFDVVLMTGEIEKTKDMQIEIIKNAFQ